MSLCHCSLCVLASERFHALWNTCHDVIKDISKVTAKFGSELVKSAICDLLSTFVITLSLFIKFCLMNTTNNVCASQRRNVDLAAQTCI